MTVGGGAYEQGISSWELRKAIRQANVIGLPIEDEDRANRTRGDLEGAFLAICRRHGLPRPEVNVRIGPFLVDDEEPERVTTILSAALGER